MSAWRHVSGSCDCPEHQAPSLDDRIARMRSKRSANGWTDEENDAWEADFRNRLEAASVGRDATI